MRSKWTVKAFSARGPLLGMGLLALEPAVAAGFHVLQRDDQPLGNCGLIDPRDMVAGDAATSPFSKSVTACKLIVIWLRITGRSRARVERDDVHPHSSLRKRWSVEFRKSRRGGILEVVRKRGFEPPLGCPN